MKFLNFLFSRITFLILLLIVYLTGIYLFFDALEKRFYLIHFFLIIGEIIVLCRLINDDSSSTIKLPWLIIIILFPLFGIILYFIFADLSLYKKDQKKIKKIFRENTISLEESKIDSIEDKKYYNQARFIQNYTKLPVSDNTSITYFRTGENFFHQYLLDLKKAKKYIFLEYFIVETGIMYSRIIDILRQKIENGVEVYFLYDDVGSYLRLQKEVKALKSLGVKLVCFNRLSLLKSWLQNNRDHRKITVIDGVIAYTGGLNIGDEYININSRFGYWKDNAIKLVGDGVKNFVCLFVQMYNSVSKKPIDVRYFLNNEKIRIYRKDGLNISFGTGPKSIYGNNVGLNLYINVIETATNYLYITTPYLIVDYFFIEALCNAAKRGVDVKIILPHIPDKKIIFMMTKSNYEKLIRNGVEIYEYAPGFIHAKTFLCDDKIGIVGTINLDNRSLIHHYECATWMYKCRCLVDIKADFLNMIENETFKIKIEKKKLDLIKKLLLSILNIFSSLL